MTVSWPHQEKEVKVKMRCVEVYVGESTDAGGHAGTWYTMDVGIPADTPPDRIPAVAEESAVREIERERGNAFPVAFVGLYHLPDAE